MAEQTRNTMDNFTALEPATAHTEPAEDADKPSAVFPSVDEHTQHVIEPLNLLESPKVRKKMCILCIVPL
jgi:hypothetical protein